MNKISPEALLLIGTLLMAFGGSMVQRRIFTGVDVFVPMFAIGIIAISQSSVVRLRRRVQALESEIAARHDEAST